MSGKQIATQKRGRRWGPAAWALSVLVGLTGAVRAQNGEAVPDPKPEGGGRAAEVRPAAAETGKPETGGEIVQTGCGSCGGVLGGAPGGLGGCVGCGGGVTCYPGYEPCDCCPPPEGAVGRLLYGIYECICCPDPCYEPRWNVLANAAFFADQVRPVTQMRLRVDRVWDLPFPDKGEFFWPRSDGCGKFQRLPGTVPPPQPCPPGGFGTPPGILQRGESSVDYSDLRLYTEGAIDRFGVFVELAYRHIEPEFYPEVSGFSDMVVGTKSMLLDCELLQLTFQFKTFIPTGDFTRGLGTGHVALEPSLLFALKLTPETYLQGQTAYWFPIGGDQQYQGAVFHYHLSLNNLLWHCGKDLQLVGTLEANGYHFLYGQYTVPTPVVPPGNMAITAVSGRAVDVGQVFSAGPGVRLNVCNKIDFGVGTALAITEDSVGDFWVRAEFRWRF